MMAAWWETGRPIWLCLIAVQAFSGVQGFLPKPARPGSDVALCRGVERGRQLPLQPQFSCTGTGRLHMLLNGLDDVAAGAVTTVSQWPFITPLDTSMLLSEEAVTYSRASYYTTLGLYALSFPGLWSVIKRATKTKYKERVYVAPGPAAPEGAKAVKQTAGEIMAYFTANNYNVLKAGEEITFQGNIVASKGQAFFLVFCTFLSLGTLALVLQIQFPDIGSFWYLLTLISPYAGVYYWQNSSRQDKATVRIETTDDEKNTEIKVLAGEEELDRMAKAMELQEKGKIRVKGLLEDIQGS